jgi:hypothetical protein
MTIKAWLCRKCGAELGTIEAGELEICRDVRSVRCADDGTTWVGCPSCPATRAWKPRPSKAA